MTVADGAGDGASSMDPTDSIQPTGSRVAPRPGATGSAAASQPARGRRSPARRTQVAAPAIRSDARAAAFFDLDNTVIQGAALFHLAKGLYRRGFFPTRMILRGLWLQAYFRIVGKENAGHVQVARDSALSFIAGHTVADLADAGDEIYEESIRQRIWPGTRALAQLHLDAGQQVWLVTAAPLEVATIIAERMGLTGALATMPESVDGIYTGRLQGDLLHGEAKAAAVRQLAVDQQLDLERCFAYSDSANDLPMLSLVGHPCAVNPDRRLSRHAQESDWQIREFRTHRRAVRLGLLGAGATGAAAAALVAGQGLRHRFRRCGAPPSI